MILRAYQQSIFEQIIAAKTNDLVQLDTGAGKTPIIAKVAAHYANAVIVCHRNILIKQASEKLAACGLTHRVIASKPTKKICANNNLEKFGQHYLNPQSTIELVSIDTINSQLKADNLIINKSAKILLVDEAHHLTDDNKWASLADALKVRCIGFTATPCRGDGYPMIKQHGGFFERILQAEGYQENATERLISEGYLAQYSAYLAINKKAISGTRRGISNNKKIWLASSAYYAFEEYAKNRQTIVIESRIANAINSDSYFKRFGIKSEVIHSGLPQYEIERILQAYEQKHIRVLIAVDMINEGFDVPDADVLILSRVVRSFGLYRQLCGRVLRPRQGKHALILDLNGKSIAKHGLPSDKIDWRERQGKVRRKNLTVCEACGAFFKATLTACPSCGEEHDVEARAEGWGAGLEKHFFDGEMIQRERQRIAAREAQRLREAEQKKELEAMAKDYLEFNTSFQVGIIGKRCKHFYETLKIELQKTISPLEYNAFFKKNNQKMGRIEFYMDVVDGNFEKFKKTQCKRLYEAHK